MVNEKIKAAEENLIHVYNRFPIALERGEGVYLYDTNGKKYLDFAAGFAVSGLGYGNQKLNAALKFQIDQLYHTSNLYYHTNCGEAAQKLNRISGMDRVFFTNSGSEANEGALKAARRYAYNKKSGRYQFIAMENSFHGRSFGAVSVTGHTAYREPFEPMLPGVSFAEFNNLDSVKALFSEKTCGVIMETIQGEGGIYPATEEFLKGVRSLCDEYGALLILDEIQCGMGRSGSMFAWQEYGVKPDVMTVAKALGNGLPIGAFLACGTAAKVMEPGDHGTTYGGNPLVCAAADKVLELFEEKNLVAHVREIGQYLWEQLEALAGRLDCVAAHRGKGLMQGLELSMPAGPVVKTALLEEHLVLISAGSQIIRFVPPLVIEKEDVDEMIVRLERAVKSVVRSVAEA